MKKTTTEIICDQCSASAEIRCEIHEAELCESHLRRHFDREKCRLVPVEKEPGPRDQLLDSMEQMNRGMEQMKRDREARMAEMDIELNKPRRIPSDFEVEMLQALKKARVFIAGTVDQKLESGAPPLADIDRAIVRAEQGLKW